MCFSCLAQLQEKLQPGTYLWVSIIVLATVAVLLLLITLEVHLKVTGFWTLDTLSDNLQDDSYDTRRYTRSGSLMFAIFLVVQILADVSFFLTRFIAYQKGLLHFSSFIYKNLFYMVIHTSHLYSVMMVLVMYPESTYANTNS